MASIPANVTKKRESGEIECSPFFDWANFRQLWGSGRRIKILSKWDTKRKKVRRMA
jgi:hypothetical protein